ncbi:PP2C family protein-serine/threonine phosphatase [Nostocoides sp.]|mgnify:CR=1 FL=1|uniref:PP2C family protein-serine/threonine phosphatase n=1 Tax=Nostocoides sp. TaxID=1917966 RepID=UPI002B988AF9|nr:protein phosphatase 2C domain-containing protein [Tetrasphaera sp.]
MIAVGQATHRGHHREQNEDSVLAAYPVFAVADGMGGHAAGEIASAIAVETLGALAGGVLTDTAALIATVQEANRRICEASRHPGQRGMGTTLTGCAELADGSWATFNVGDSRVLLIHEGEVRQITTDHSEVQDMVTLGILAPDEAAVHPMRHIVTRSLGGRTEVAIDVERIEVGAGDRLLVCSDGLTDEVPPDELYWVLESARDPQDAADALVQAALGAGGHDNVTVVVIDILSQD